MPRTGLYMVCLLMGAQVLLGGVGLWAHSFPWVGVLVSVLYTWVVVRTASLVRADLRKASKARRQRASWAAIVWIAGLWQLTSVVLVPGWLPTWFTDVWHGAITPAAQVLERVVPAIEGILTSHIAWAFVVELLMFVPVAASNGGEAKSTPAAPPNRNTGVSGEWVPARRRADVPTRGLRIK